MRRNVGLVLIGLSGFLIALAPLVRFYVAHQVIAAPANLFQQVTLQATRASYLDGGDQKIYKNRTVKAVNTIRGDVRAATGKIAVWDSFTAVEDPARNYTVEIQQQRAAFDRRTGRLTDTHGASVAGDTNVRQSGIGISWPIGVQKRTYPYFDLATKRAWPMVYRGTERFHGITTYRFVQHVPPTVTGPIKGGVPPSLVGGKKATKYPGYDKKLHSVPVDRVDEETVTVLVDPRTGIVVDEEQKVIARLRSKDGVDRAVVADFDLKMTDASRRALVHRTRGEALKIAAIRDVVPFGAAGLGIALLVVGLVLAIPGSQTIVPLTPGGGPSGDPAWRGDRPAGGAPGGAPEGTPGGAPEGTAGHGAPEAGGRRETARPGSPDGLTPPA